MVRIYKTVTVDVDVELDESDLDASDIIDWLKCADDDELAFIQRRANIPLGKDIFVNLCRALEFFGVEHFLQVFADEVCKIDGDMGLTARCCIDEFLENRK